MRERQFQGFKKDVDVRLVQLGQYLTQVIRLADWSNQLQWDGIEVDVNALVADPTKQV